MKNRAFKMYLVSRSADRDGLALIISMMLSDQHQMAYELMDEAEAEFNMEGFKKAANFLLNQCSDNV